MSDPSAEPTHEETVASLQQRLEQSHQRLLQSELRTHAVRAGIVDLDGLKMLDMSKLKLGEDGTVTDAEKVFADLKRDKPYLFARAAPAPHSTSNPTAAPKADPADAGNAMKMSYTDWQAARARLLGRR